MDDTMPLKTKPLKMRSLKRDHLELAQLLVFIVLMILLFSLACFVGDGEPKISSVCKITQYGTNGFGHQLDGKLSFMVLGLLFPDRFAYVHQPFENFTDVKDIGKYIDHRMGFTNKIFTQIQPEWRLEHVEDMTEFVENTGNVSCREDTVYWSDNAWGTVYHNTTLKREINGILYSSDFLNIVFAYHALYLPHETSADIWGSFPPSILKWVAEENLLGVKHVVVHIHRGDAMWRSMTEEYFNAGIEFYKAFFRNYYVVYHIETDDPEWEYVAKTLPERLGRSNMEVNGPSKSGFGLRSLFRRMVVADGLIASDGPLDRVASMYRLNSNPVVAPDHPYFQVLDTWVHVRCPTKCSV